MRLGWTELVLVLVIVLVIFGGSKLSGLGSMLGKNIKEFRREVTGTELKEKEKEVEE